jgi:hypothetical protein
VAFPFFAEEGVAAHVCRDTVVAVIQLLLSPCFWNRTLVADRTQSRSRRDTLSAHPYLHDHEVETEVGHFVMEVRAESRTDVHCGYPERDVESTQDSIVRSSQLSSCRWGSSSLESMQSFTIRLASLKA